MELIDLSPAFEAAASDGKMLYYPLDTHWNSEGREIAAGVVGTILRNKIMLSSTRKAG
jgi:SGNH hydrolase-like domain, acetyltransferase AlgX